MQFINTCKDVQFKIWPSKIFFCNKNRRSRIRVSWYDILYYDAIINSYIMKTQKNYVVEYYQFIFNTLIKINNETYVKIFMPNMIISVTRVQTVKIILWEIRHTFDQSLLLVFYTDNIPDKNMDSLLLIFIIFKKCIDLCTF